MPIISIILPVYNTEKYLGKCLDSLKVQTFPDIEVLCVDDGSQDGSRRICEEYMLADKRFKLLSQPNSGPAAARNLGLRNAAGRYLMFCDADDWYQPDICEKLLKAITASQTDIAICGCRVIDESEQVRPQEDIDYYRLYYSGKQQITGELIQRTNVMLWNKIFKADLVRQYGIDFPTGYEYDDNCFYWQYMCVAKTACFLDEELYNYLRRNDSVMGKVYNRKNKGVYDSLYSLEYFYDFLRRNSLEKRYKRLFVDIYQNCWRFCTGFLDERQYAQAYKIFNRFRRILPPEVSFELKKHCRPRYLLRLGNFKLAEFICLNGKDGLTGCRLIDIRLVLFSKLPLFNLSLKNAVLRLKFCGLRILRLRQRK